MFTQMVGKPPSSIVTIEIGSSASVASAGTSETFSVDVGTAATGRVIVISCFWEDGNDLTLDTLTIGGTGATIHVQDSANDGGPGYLNSAIASAIVAAGTTLDVVCGWSGTATNAAVSAVSLYGTDGNTPYATATDENSTGANLTLSVNVEPGGAIVSCFSVDDDSNPSTSWTGLTERGAIGGNLHADFNLTWAADKIGTGYAPRAIVGVSDADWDLAIGYAASWSPA
jgi:hypothetical protein